MRRSAGGGLLLSAAGDAISTVRGALVSVDDAQNDVAEATQVTETAEVTASARSYYTTGARTTPVRSGPSNNHSLVRTLPKRSRVTIYCQTPGQRVSGPYGTTAIWDRIGSGQYISDSFVYTGSDGYVAPRC